jgi:hypothetical protein
MAIHSGSRSRARGWARDFYKAYPEMQGILYAASTRDGAPAMALNERSSAFQYFQHIPSFTAPWEMMRCWML